ncbi:cupin domain-containing protein [Caulobacter sp. X]|uniref:cupin domain-containing protein n=1 Tax=Caulobacter sp. X TaxID=2048901 RepID=UPI000C1598CE|nr:cupin domain-containing protein [Caulobacter sp. X]PIB95242.1 hypothetical protein CSW60_22080 [Caulobacter sp. X]
MDLALYTIEDGADQAPRVTQSALPPLEVIADLHVFYAPLLSIESKGVTLARGRVEPGVEVPPHAAGSRYIALVVSGTGLLTLMRATVDVPETSLAYQPGTLIDFPPNARHGWINTGPEPLEWIGLDLGA